MTDVAESMLLAAATLHLGFQLTVTALVYPALARVDAQHWTAAHARHSRAIAPLVGVVYLAVLVAGAALAISARSFPAVALALVAAAPMLVTLGWAAPLHQRLGAHDPGLIARLLVVDRWRAAAALVAAGVVLLAVVT